MGVEDQQAAGADRILTVPQGDFDLSRHPLRERQPLRAWDAADDYLLTHLADLEISPSSALIVNDAFGALTTALAGEWSVQMQSDSWLAHAGARANLEANGHDPSTVTFLDPLQSPARPFEVLLFKVPKTLAMLEDQLHRLRPHLSEGTLIVGAGMVKQIHTSTLELCQRLLGSTTTSLARRRGRLIHCAVDAGHAGDPSCGGPDSPYPTTYELEGTGLLLSNHAALFAREDLDGGTRLLLENLLKAPAARRIVDLGCGNGALGIIAARRHRDASLVFADESAMAVASARANFGAAFGEGREATFHWTDCLDGVASDGSESASAESGWADLVLCNPPFHQQQAMGDDVAWRMFGAARRALGSEGSLWIVGNRHLGYHTKLRRLFGNGEVVASNRKFVVLKAVKRD